MPLKCENCGTNGFRLRRADGGAEAECVMCGAVIPNSVLRATTGLPPKMITVQRSARAMVHRYGKDAIIQAAIRANDQLRKGDLDRLHLWQAIIQAIHGLQATKPADGEAANRRAGP